MNEINDQALLAASDREYKEKFIAQSKDLIIRIASKACGRYITISDDEWSVALYAYNKGIDTYSVDKGDFVPYAGVVIKRALIDYYRSEKKHESEIPYSPEDMSGEGDVSEDGTNPAFYAVVRESADADIKERRSLDIKEEIEEVNERLKAYGFSFYDIADCSPVASKTKKMCGKVIAQILDNREMTEAIERSGRLSALRLHKELGVSVKLLDRYRRYIVMAVIILNGEYPLLADYLQYVKKGDG